MLHMRVVGLTLIRFLIGSIFVNCFWTTSSNTSFTLRSMAVAVDCVSKTCSLKLGTWFLDPVLKRCFNSVGENDQAGSQTV